MFPCSLKYFANVPLFPKTPGRSSLVERPTGKIATGWGWNPHGGLRLFLCPTLMTNEFNPLGFPSGLYGASLEWQIGEPP